jgi:disease resistance protein
MSLKCRRFGCNSAYDSEQNSQDSCRFHPQAPLFRDLRKLWPCCGVEKHDWDDFMRVPGCQVGPHSDAKPVGLSRNPSHSSTPAPLPARTPPPAPAPAAPAPAPAKKPMVTASGKFKCDNAGCNAEFDPEELSGNFCQHHPGKPLFRDTRKWWTCCDRAAYDWDDFMKIPPCSTSVHRPKLV